MKSRILAAALAMTTALAPVKSFAETLIFGTSNPPMHPINQLIMIPWAEKVNQTSSGAVELDVRHGPTFVGHNNYVDRVLDDVAQIAWGMLVFDPGRFPKSLVATMPFIDGSPQDFAVSFCNMYEAGDFGDEFAAYKPLFFVPFPQSTIHMNGSPITKLEDLAGKKMMAGSPILGAVISAYGGTPLSTNLPDQYQALQRGTADGTFMTFTAFPGFKLNEVTTDHLSLPLGGAMGMVFMTKARYEALSPEAKAAIDANSGCDVTKEMGGKVIGWEEGGKGFTAANGNHTFNELPAEEVAAAKARLFDGIVAGFGKRVPGGEELVKKFADGVAAARN